LNCYRRDLEKRGKIPYGKEDGHTPHGSCKSKEAARKGGKGEIQKKEKKNEWEAIEVPSVMLSPSGLKVKAESKE